ncbi:hypothetical protein FOA52_009654 [Chlamydomonas sp. UWO 241]|nr:hypothetical protein FOA52_009654 [Chlamydomonas sp. UWO 241]
MQPCRLPSGVAIGDVVELKGAPVVQRPSSLHDVGNAFALRAGYGCDVRRVCETPAGLVEVQKAVLAQAAAPAAPQQQNQQQQQQVAPPAVSVAPPQNQQQQQQQLEPPTASAAPSQRQQIVPLSVSSAPQQQQQQQQQQVEDASEGSMSWEDDVASQNPWGPWPEEEGGWSMEGEACFGEGDESTSSSPAPTPTPAHAHVHAPAQSRHERLMPLRAAVPPIPSAARQPVRGAGEHQRRKPIAPPAAGAAPLERERNAPVSNESVPAPVSAPPAHAHALAPAPSAAPVPTHAHEPAHAHAHAHHPASHAKPPPAGLEPAGTAEDEYDERCPSTDELEDGV